VDNKSLQISDLSPVRRENSRAFRCGTMPLLMEPIVSPRKAVLLASTFRRLVRRGARANISKLLGKTRPEDVALQLPGLTPAEQADVFRILISDFPENAGVVLTELDSPYQANVINELDRGDIEALFDGMPVDDAVSVVDSLPEEVRRQVIEIVELGDLEQVQEHLTYKDDSAGRIMDSEYLALREDKTVGEAIREIQDSRGIQTTGNIFYVYIVDSSGHLVGVTSLRQLLLNDPTVALSEIMTRSLIKVDTDTDQEEVAELANRYDLLAIPVTDGSNRLVGIVTVDDIIDVFQEEATEDFFKMVGTSDDEIVYENRSLKVAGIRLPWLILNLVGLGFGGLMIERFQVSLQEALFLLTFVPVVMGMGGNLGSQTSTIAVRGMATGRIEASRDRSRSFVWQQVKVGAILGVACAALAAIGAYVLEAYIKNGSEVELLPYAAVVGVSLFAAMVLASLNGAMIPLIFRRLGIDPAVASGPLVTTSNDLTGIIIYFGLASLLIEHLVR